MNFDTSGIRRTREISLGSRLWWGLGFFLRHAWVIVILVTVHRSRPNIPRNIVLHEVRADHPPLRGAAPIRPGDLCTRGLGRLQRMNYDQDIARRQPTGFIVRHTRCESRVQSIGIDCNINEALPRQGIVQPVPQSFPGLRPSVRVQPARVKQPWSESTAWLQTLVFESVRDMCIKHDEFCHSTTYACTPCFSR